MSSATLGYVAARPVYHFVLCDPFGLLITRSIFPEG